MTIPTLGSTAFTDHVMGNTRCTKPLAGTGIEGARTTVNEEVVPPANGYDMVAVATGNVPFELYIFDCILMGIVVIVNPNEV